MFWTLIVLSNTLIACARGEPACSLVLMTVPGYNSQQECERAGEYSIWHGEEPHGGRFSSKSFRDNGGNHDISFECVPGNDKR